MLAVMRKRCDCGYMTTVILPPVAIYNRPTLRATIAAAIVCLMCEPEKANDICGSCLLPFHVMRNRWGKPKAHSGGLCFKCYQRKRRRERALQSLAPFYDGSNGVLVGEG